jgi:methyl-accepting chemotaxis protein
MLCIGGMLAAVMCLAGVAWYATSSLGDELNFATTTVGTRAITAGVLKSDVLAMHVSSSRMLLYSLSHDTQLAELGRDQYRQSVKAAKASIAAIRSLVTTEEDKTLISAIDSDLDLYTTYFEQESSLISSGKTMAALIIYREKNGAIGDRMEAATARYTEMQKAALAAANATGIQKTASARWTAALFVIIALAVVVMITIVVRTIASRLQTIAASLSDGASQIASGSNQVATTSQSLAEGASEQASSLEETSASAEQITSMTRQNAANTSQVAQLMTTVDHRVTEGNSTLALMITSMKRSAQAAKDTAALIEESIATSNQGSTQLQKVADVVGSITEATMKVKVLVDEVNIGSQEQSKGIEEIARSLTEMDKVTQGTAAAAEESASASQEMSAQAQSLAHIVEELRTMAG